MIEPGVVIDNSSGVYTAEEICLKLLDYLETLTGEESPQVAIEISAVPEVYSEEDQSQTYHEIENELIDAINEKLPDRDITLILTVGETEPGVYIVREMSADEFNGIN